MNARHLSFAGLVACVALAGVAHAQNITTNYTPSPADLNDLDHHKLYTWKIDGIDLTNREIVSASLSFTNIRNWDSSANVLHLHLFDNAVFSGVKDFTDDDPNNSNVTDLTDDFKSTRYHNGTDATGATAPWLIANGTASSFLADKSFGTSATNWSYDLMANGKAQVLTDYLLNGKNIAFGLDSDCHYYNDGVKFTVVTKAASNPGGQYGKAIPEAGTVSLLALGGLGLVGIVTRRRK